MLEAIAKQSVNNSEKISCFQVARIKIQEGTPLRSKQDAYASSGQRREMCNVWARMADMNVPAPILCGSSPTRWRPLRIIEFNDPQS